MLFAGYFTHAQKETEIVGIVVDQLTSEPLDYVNVYFKGTSIGTITDADGYFSLKGSGKEKEIVVSIVGYEQQHIKIKEGKHQTLTIQLKSQLVNLDEITVLSGENPAWAIMREAVKNKEKHDKRNLTAYEYQSYNRIEFDIDNISTKLQKRKLVEDIWGSIDSASLEKNEKGNAILPIFLSESISRYYVKNDPFARREEVQKTKVSGVAVEDGSMVSQLVGTAYQDYNFYQNWLRFLEKEFISPISDSWKMYYDYEIMDTLFVGGDHCYEMALFPNREQDPAFNGTIWITTNDFALKKIDVYIDKATNLNFIEKIELKQELNKSETGHWLPSKTHMVVDVSDLSKNSASFLIKVYNTTSDWKVNLLKDKKFYANEVLIAEDFNNYEPEYWSNVRPESLSMQQLKTYKVIDTLVEIPRVRSYVEFVKLATTGYWRRGKIDLGPYLYSYAYNNFEGHAIRIGMKTNEYFSRKITLKGYGGYGTLDDEWKYGFTGSYIIRRKPWTEFKVHSSHDVQQVGISADELIDNNYIFYAATRWQTFRRPYYISDNSFSLQTEPARGLTHQLTLRHQYYDPQYAFAYYENPDYPESSLKKSDISTSTIKFSTKWARDEMFMQDGNERISLGPRRSPVIKFDYTYGFKGIIESDFEYHKIHMEVMKKLRLGGLGVSRLTLKGGYIFGQLPYLLLENHIGNESMFYTTGAFNTMNYFEFVSDKYASLHYQHHFQGLIMNKIPLMRKLKWRLLGTANILSGSLRQENIDIMVPVEDQDGNSTLGFYYLNPSIPYVELGYGIENIFKIIRVDGVHRLTYRDEENAQKFVLKFSVQFKL